MNRVETQRSDKTSSMHEGPSEEAKHLANADAAIMLIECLILTLVEQGLVTTQEVVGTVEAALRTKLQMVADQEHPRIAAVAVGVLTRLSNSLAAKKP
jgi:hypothetical protein